MNFPKSVIDLEALLYALTQQSHPLPEPLQRSLQAVGNDLREDNLDSARQLRDLIKQYPPLETTYKAVLEQWDEQYAAQERAKSLSATFPKTARLDCLLVYNVMPTFDWVTTAKQFARQESPQTSFSFWDKTDRIAVMIAGGAALGGAIAQLPGAVIGGGLAGGYGWYISFAKSKSTQNS